MSLKPLNSPGGFSVGEITSGAINVISSTGNVTTGNLISNTGSTGNINVKAGNLIVGDAGAGYIYANGAFITGLPAPYSNANVESYLPLYTGSLPSLTGNVITTANITASYFIGNGSTLFGVPYSNLVGAYNNASVTNYLGSNANVSLITTGTITTTANISGNYIFGNGAFLTGMYSNANAKAYLESGATINANFGGGNISTAGTANFGVTTVNGNLNVAGNIIATGNITYIGVQDLVISDPMIYLGSNNTADLVDIGIVGSYNDGTYAHTGVVRDHTDETWKVFQGVTTEPNTVVDWSQAVYAPFKSGAITSNASIQANTTITAVGNISGANFNTTGNVTATGNITGGNIVSTHAVIGNIDVGNIQVSGNISVDSLYSNTFVTAAGNISGGNISTTGTVSATGNITGGNLTSNGTATVAGTATVGNLSTAGIVTATGNVTGGNVSTAGTVTATGNITGGNVSTAGQVTATGNVTGGNVSTAGQVTATGNVTGGNINTTGNVVTGAIKTDNYLYANGQPLDMQQPAGSNTQIQFNSDSNFGATPNFTFDVASNTLTVTGTSTTTGNLSAGNISTAGQIVATGNITGGNLISNHAVIGNIDVGNIAVTGNVTVNSLTSNTTVTASGNVSGNNVIASNYLQLQAASSTAVREEAYTVVTTATSLQTVATIAVATLPASTQSIEVTMRGVSGNNTQVGKMLVSWNGANLSDYARYGEVILGNGCGVPSATFDGTNVLVQVTPVSVTSTTWTAKVTSV